MTYVTKIEITEQLEIQKIEILAIMKENHEELARMIVAGFENTASKELVDSFRRELKVDISDFKAEYQRDIERIDLRLSNLTPQFELDDLKRRTLSLEQRIGIAK